jgi:hypothetical protein
MAVVFEEEDSRLKRRVVLKIDAPGDCAKSGATEYRAKRS